jgi:hypothetical protein
MQQQVSHVDKVGKRGIGGCVQDILGSHGADGGDILEDIDELRRDAKGRGEITECFAEEISLCISVQQGRRYCRSGSEEDAHDFGRGEEWSYIHE